MESGCDKRTEPSALSRKYYVSSWESSIFDTIKLTNFVEFCKGITNFVANFSPLLLKLLPIKKSTLPYF